jgi:excisionase family DNA binding protein
MVNGLEVPCLLSVGDAARRLTISVRSVRTLIRTGRLRVVRVTARRVAIDESDLAKYVASRRSPRPFHKVGNRGEVPGGDRNRLGGSGPVHAHGPARGVAHV